MDEQILKICERITITDDYKDALERHQEAHETSKAVLTISSGLSIMSFICSSAAFALVVIAMTTKRLPRHKYSIVSSRTLSDSIYSISVITFSFVANKETATFFVLLLFVLCSTFGLIHLGLSHFAIIALKQTNSQNLDCFQFLTLRKLLTVIVLLWILSALYCIAFISLAAVIATPKYSIEICTYRACQKPLLIISLCFIGILAVGCTLYYIAVAQTLRNVYKNEKIYSKVMITRQKLFDFLSYGGHILIFAITSSFIFIGTAYILKSAWIYDKLRIFNGCQIVNYINAAIRSENLAGAAVLLYCCRIILDSVLLIATDPTNFLPWILNRDQKVVTFKLVYCKQ
uniref:G_PROTEIN_RECEP_F1_2 domain-containing protein n=1 Tax=Syphacia muris TaxID=451379 RepID=A0A0N5AJ35_9BILA